MDYYSDNEYDGDDNNTDNVRFIQCYCEGVCPFGDEKGICGVTVPGGKCFSVTELEKDEYTGEEYTTTSYGCLEDNQMASLQCKWNQIPHKIKKNIYCCDDGDFCNKDLNPKFVTENKLTVLILTTSIISLLIILFLTGIIYYFHRKKAIRLCKKSETCDIEKNADLDIKNENINNNLSIIDLSSGSGSGFPKMVQRTIAKQVEMEKVIGKGRYGEVWLSRWRGEKVAAKIFLSTQEKSWLRETEIYKTILMRHENILGFIASDIKGTSGWTQLLLITDYHENGSLYDYLQNNTLSRDFLLTMTLGISKGLSHLHTEILGVPGKPPIAHRDLKSKNILVKRNLDCCIADFGLAVQYDGVTKSVDLPLTDRSGTKRYMAPEILSRSMNFKNFESHKMADIYSFGLVLWEMSIRCYTNNHKPSEYQIPFFDSVTNDPDFDEMLNVVCVKKIRPIIPNNWEDEPILKTMAKIIQEMWHDNPAVRLTALRVKKTLSKLIALNADIMCTKNNIDFEI